MDPTARTGKCVVCGGTITEQLGWEYDPSTGPLIIGPGSRKQYKRTTTGLSCQACGLRYSSLPSSDEAQVLRRNDLVVQLSKATDDINALNQRIADMKKTVESALQDFGTCGDNSCLVQKPSGMATNGGCRCFEDLQTKDRMRTHALIRRIKQLLKE